MRRTFMNVPGIKMNVHEWLWMIIHERSRMIANDYERSRTIWTFTNVREYCSRIRTSGSYEWPVLYSEFSDPCTEVYPSVTFDVPIPSLSRLQPYFIVLSCFNIIHIYIRVFLKFFGKNNQNFHKDSIFGY